jgi:transaldolase
MLRDGGCNNEMISIHLDTADLQTVAHMSLDARVSGFTSNPSIARKQGIANYEQWAIAYAAMAGKKPVSIEIIADDFVEMKRQALRLNKVGPNVFVKVPITTTMGESCLPLVRDLAKDGVKINLTALTTPAQIRAAYLAVAEAPIIFSIFVGRIADTGVEIEPMEYGLLNGGPIQRLWASTREVLNIYQAQRAGFDIITVSPELFAKYNAMKGRDLTQLSLETVRQFRDDAMKSGYTL